MNFPNNVQYAPSHEWVETLENGNVRIGVSDYAQSQLGDLVFVNLPEEGDELTAGVSFADVESVKAVADIIAPVSGRVVAINEELLDSPQLINEDPYGAWFVEVEDPQDAEELMDAAAYQAHCAAQGE